MAVALGPPWSIRCSVREALQRAARLIVRADPIRLFHFGGSRRDTPVPLDGRMFARSARAVLTIRHYGRNV
ncbi:MAG: hypothetical protein QOJ04_5909 [Caballeronia sp.]|jgi:hypothetical protein|nr:hypothetical protein [Caballeronia sp.]